MIEFIMKINIMIVLTANGCLSSKIMIMYYITGRKIYMMKSLDKSWI